jgi:hypothetical protein
MAEWVERNGGARGLVLKSVLIVLAVYHIGIGLCSTLAAGATVSFAASFYGLDLNASAPQFAYMLKAMGMYALFTGGLVVVALTDPKRHRALIVAVAVLLFMRATTRLLFFDVLDQAFALTWGQNLVNVTLLVGKGALLLWAIGPGEAPAAVPTKAPLLPVGALTSASRRLAAASRRLAPSPFASASGLR